MDKVRILGVNFDKVTLKQAVDHAFHMIENGEKSLVVTPNAEIVYECMQNTELNRIVNQAALVLPDGIGVVRLSAFIRHLCQKKLLESILPLRYVSG